MHTCDISRDALDHLQLASPSSLASQVDLSDGGRSARWCDGASRTLVASTSSSTTQGSQVQPPLSRTSRSVTGANALRSISTATS